VGAFYAAAFAAAKIRDAQDRARISIGILVKRSFSTRTATASKPFTTYPSIDRHASSKPMKHAGAEALCELSDLLAAVRARGPREVRPGVFYRKGKAWLHFHEDKTGLFADLRVRGHWKRFCVSDARERASFIALIDGNP
jgi:hypothetical protein